MAQSGARSAVKVNILDSADAVSWLFMFCSLLMAAGLVHM